MSLIVQYRLDEVSASLGTDSVGSLDMTNTTVTSFSDATYGNVAYFDGSSYLSLPSVSVPTAITQDNDRTFSCWFNRTTGQTIHSNGTTGSGTRYRAQFNGNGTLNIDYSGSVCTTAAALDSTWYHYASTYTESTSLQTIYIDGVIQVSESRAVVNTGSGGLLELGRDPHKTSSELTGYISDFRIYDGVLDATSIADIYAAGSLDRNLLSATMYTHVADITWSAVSGATTYTVTQTEDAGDPVIIASDISDLTISSYNLNPGSSYEYNLYTDLDLVTPESTTTETALAVDTTSVTDLMVRLGNDLTVIDESSVDAIETELRNVLSTGDEVILTSGSSLFVQDADTIEVVKGKDVLTPFVTSVASQAITVTTAEGGSSAITYDESLNQVTFDGTTTLDVGQYAVVGKYKVKVTEV